MSTNRVQLTSPAYLVAMAAIVFNGAIFGFFFAWACSTLWGLDITDPRVAIDAMQSMNSIVRNGVFAPAFFGTPFVLLAAGLVARSSGRMRSGGFFLAAAVVYFFGGLLLTAAVNVPMNRNLVDVVIPESIQAAEVIWTDYSDKWKVWNAVRTVFSGISLALAAAGLATLSEVTRKSQDREA